MSKEIPEKFTRLKGKFPEGAKTMQQKSKGHATTTTKMPPEKEGGLADTLSAMTHHR